MYAPALVGGADVRGSLLGDATIHATFERFRDLDVAFVGIGSITEPDASRLVYGGALGADEVQRLREHGAVGDVIAYLFDADGQRRQERARGPHARDRARRSPARSRVGSASQPASRRRPRSAVPYEEGS